jgi:hypothetical protein
MMTAPTETTPALWARTWATARPYARPMPRAGAWYPVVGEASGDRLVIQIRDKKVAIQKKFMEVREKRPATFTAVTRTRTTVTTMNQRGMDIPRIYAVCPNCMNRVTAFPGQASANCRACGHEGEIAWWETG